MQQLVDSILQNFLWLQTLLQVIVDIGIRLRDVPSSIGGSLSMETSSSDGDYDSEKDG